MSWEQDWKQMEEQGDSDLTALLQKNNLHGLHSNNPLEKMSHKLRLNMIYTFLTCVSYIVLLVLFPIWQVQLSIYVALAFSIWGLYGAWRRYKEINGTISANSPVLDELKRHHRSIKRWIQWQLRASLLVYPIAAAGGFMLGSVLATDKPVEAILAKPGMPIKIVVTSLLLMLIGYWSAKWMVHRWYGKHLDDLQQTIQQLESEE